MLLQTNGTTNDEPGPFDSVSPGFESVHQRSLRQPRSHPANRNVQIVCRRGAAKELKIAFASQVRKSLACMNDHELTS